MTIEPMWDLDGDMLPSQDEIARRFDSDGVILVRHLFDSTTIDRLADDFDQIVVQLERSGDDIDATWESATTEPNDRIVHTHNVQAYSAAWLDAFRNDRFLYIASAILGDDVVLHHSKLFQKPSGHGSPFPMHQDWRYFPTSDDRNIAAIIHLTDATIDMGCVTAFPRSHRIGRRNSSSGSPEWDLPSDYQAFAAEFPSQDATPFEAESGDVLFFSSLTVHGSGPNRSNSTRKTVLAQLYDGRAELEESEHPVANLVLRGRNRTTSRWRAAGSAPMEAQ